MEDLRFDVRVVRNLIRRGTTTQKEYQAYIDSLEDCVKDAEQVGSHFSNPYESRHAQEIESRRRG